MNKKILIVEDDATLRQTLAEFLEAENFSAVVASDGEEGVQKTITEMPDLILLDIVLPKKDGYEVIKTLKGDKKTKNIPIVVLTNLGGLSNMEKALALGAITYLVKGDYQLKEIMEKIKEVLLSKK